MPATTIPLAAGFAPATRSDWRALVDKTLKGAAFESLSSPGPDGLTIQPLYERWVAPRTFAPAPREGERPWDVRARVAQPGLASASMALVEELAGGAASAIIAIGSGVGDGVSVTSEEALTELLDGVLIDIAPIGLDAGYLGARMADWLSAAAKGSPAAPLAFHLDPLSAFALSGASPGPIESHLIAAANSAARLMPIHPKASCFLASGMVVHEAGGSPAQELAFALAAALAYAKALARAGHDVTAALRVIVLGLTVDTDPLVSIAKLRAARMLWTRFARVLGVDAPAVIEARSSRRMLVKADPWTNMVRLTAAAFGAAVGGADAIVLGAFTDPLGLPTAFARRTARNIQLILMEEGHLGAVADPVAGSGAFETLSRDLARSAWEDFNAIEAAGGLPAALREGMIASNCEIARARLKTALADGEMKIVGVTDFRTDESRIPAVEIEASTPPAPDPALPGPDSECPALIPVRLEDLAA